MGRWRRKSGSCRILIRGRGKERSGMKYGEERRVRDQLVIRTTAVPLGLPPESLSSTPILPSSSSQLTHFYFAHHTLICRGYAAIR